MLIIAVLCVSLFSLGGAPVAFADVQGAEGAGGGVPVRIAGDISTKYQFEATGDFTTALSHTMSEGLQLDLFVPSADSSRDLLDAHVSADAREILNDNQYHTSYYPLQSLVDAWSTPSNGNLYEAYVDLNRLLPSLPLVRLGRQAAVRDEPFFFDGATVDLSVGGLFDLVMFGGAAVHFYEIDYAWGTDFLGGAGLDFHPIPDTRLSADYAFIQDTRSLFLGATQSNHLLSFKLWQRLFSLVRLSAGFRMINFAPDDTYIRASASFPSIALDLSGAYFIQFAPQLELSNELSGYYDVIGQSLPFQSAELKARILLGPHLAVDAAGVLRGLLGGQADTPFNRQYAKVSATIEVLDIYIRGLSLSVPGDLWFSGNNQYYSTGFSIAYQPSARHTSLSIEAGSYFSLYKYDYNAPFLATYLGEMENVQSYYLKANIPIGRYLMVQARYELEQGTEFLLGAQTFHTFSLGVRSEF